MKKQSSEARMAMENCCLPKIFLYFLALIVLIGSQLKSRSFKLENVRHDLKKYLQRELIM